MAAVAVAFMTFSVGLLLGVSVVQVTAGLLSGVVLLSLAIAVTATVGLILPALHKPAPALIAKLVSE